MHGAGGTLKEAFERAPRGAGRRVRPLADLRALPAVRRVQRLWDELDGIERPVIWTAERDREVWDELQG